jgi:hypothetical protein
MSDERGRYIVYITFGEATVPVLCTGMVDDEFREGMIYLKEVSDLKDNMYPKVLIEDMSIPKDMIKYYLKGTEKEEDLDLEEKNDENEPTVSKAYDSQSDILS